MQIVYATGAPVRFGPAVVALGAFDGVHAGHRVLAEQVAERAVRERVRSVAAVLWEGVSAGAALLTLLDERLELLAGLGCFDAALVLSGLPDTSPMTGDEVVRRIAAWAEPVAILAGEDAVPRLPGGPPAASAVRPARDIEHVAAVERNTGARITELLLAGEVRAAGELLGHPYGMRGEVISGDRRGRALGFPTANLRLDARKALPANGIYAVRVRLPGERASAHPAVASLGVRPQFGSGMPRLLEVFLLDAALDLYGLTIGVEFAQRLREERRFPDVEALKEQMARDVGMARDVLSSGGEPSARN
jgi:riboflavin kinase/FMN adenylyltransferase